MKIKFSYIIFIFIFLSCSSKNLNPDWYLNEKKSEDKNFIYGYGEGKTFEIAKKNALKNIAQSIKVNIKAIEKSTYKKIISSLDKKYSSKFYSNVEITTDILLNNIEIEKKEFFNNNFFVIYKYDNRNLISKLTEGRNKKHIFIKKNTLKNSIPFSQKILNYNIFDKDFSVIREHQNWYILYTGKKYIIKPEEWFFDFFIEKNISKYLSINISPKSILKNKDFYFLEIFTKKKGYLSLFHVTEHGQVLVFFKNKKINAYDNIYYPDKKRYFGLSAEKTNAGFTRDFIIAVLTESPNHNFTTFINVGEQVADENDERLYSYNKLLELIDENCCWVSSFIEIH